MMFIHLLYVHVQVSVEQQMSDREKKMAEKISQLEMSSQKLSTKK